MSPLRLLSVGILLVAGCAVAPQVSPMLGAEEIELARDLAEAALPPLPGHTYFIKVELLPEAEVRAPGRRVMVQHYRYLGDRTVFTMVDLRRREVVKVESAEHYPTGLAAEERARAESLARGDVRLQPLFADGRVRCDFRPLNPDAEDPLHGYRVVHVLLSGPDGSLPRPRVLVDLSTDRVLLTQ